MSTAPDPEKRWRIEAAASPRRFVEVTGRRMALLGREDGVFECWMWPLCLFDGFHLVFHPHGGTSGIPGSAIVSRVVVEPHALELVYVHPDFTVRQVFFASTDERALTCVLRLKSGGPVDVEARVTPAMRAQWPAGLGGAIAAREEETGALLLTEELGRFAALVGSPTAAPVAVEADHGLTREPVSIRVRLQPDLEPAVIVVAGAQVEPEPLSDAARLGEADAARGFSRADRAIHAARRLWHATSRDWVSKLNERHLRWTRWVRKGIDADLPVFPGSWVRRARPQVWSRRAQEFPPAEPAIGGSRSLWYATERDRPSERPAFLWLSKRKSASPLSTACDWARIAIARAWVEVDGVGSGLLAGLAPSDGTGRPGFGWIFDGDGMTAARALTATGDFGYVREILRLAAGRQREDGKLMHELVLSAGLCRWAEDYPYAYYKAGNTPALVAVLDHYVETSGDLEFARELLPNVQRAIEWCARCVDETGLIANTKAGIAAVEAGPLVGRIQAEAYLNGIWMSALVGGVRLAKALDERALAGRCETLLARAREGFESLWSEERGRYGFARMRDGTRCDDLTAYTAHPLSRDHGSPDRIRSSVAQLNHPELVADWGARMFSTRSSVYDPASYNTGAVFPYLTNFVCLALYEHGDPMAARQVLDGLVALHGFSGLGFIPEHLRGDRAVAPARGVPHQIFSSAAVIQSAIYGIWGVRCEGGRSVRLRPAMNGDDVETLRVSIGRAQLRAVAWVEQRDSKTRCRALVLNPGSSQHSVEFSIRPRFPLGTVVHGILADGGRASGTDPTRITLEPGQGWTGNWEISLGPWARFSGGVVRKDAPSRDLRLLHTRLEGSRVVWTVAGLPATAHDLPFRRGRASAIRGAEELDQPGDPNATTLRVKLPSGSDFVEHEVEFELA